MHASWTKICVMAFFDGRLESCYLSLRGMPRSLGYSRTIVSIYSLVKRSSICQPKSIPLCYHSETLLSPAKVMGVRNAMAKIFFNNDFIWMNILATSFTKGIMGRRCTCLKMAYNSKFKFTNITYVKYRWPCNVQADFGSYGTLVSKWPVTQKRWVVELWGVKSGILVRQMWGTDLT